MKDLKIYLRFSRLLIWVAVLAVLAVAPLRVAGQEAGSKPEIASQGSQAPADVKPDAAQSEEEQQNNAFRLEGPLVKWTAKTLNAPVTAVARGFEIINFLIIVLGIGVPLVRWLPKFLRNRAEKVKSDIESARKVTEGANARLSAVEAKLASLGEEIQKFRIEVEAESLQDEARIKASLGDESARIVEAAEQEIGMAAAQARRGLRNFAADLAIENATKQLILTPETDRALIAEFVGDVVRNGASGGGKN